MARADPARAGLTVRCAIYTRKSSDEGLEQEFNSLDAQREACEAYIVSQRHAGWVALADMYDDGGLSGGTRCSSFAVAVVTSDAGRLPTANLTARSAPA
jgi:site-specific DNA recombinase